MYSISDYGAMIADGVRMQAFARALRGAITPESVVVDIGTGTGVFALLACRLGARRVYAIEPADAIQVARDVAGANGDADRVVFIQALSTDVTLPERADVIVSDIGGLLPWFQTHLPAILDARRRFLAAGGALIPQRDRAWAAVVEAPDAYAQRTAVWDDPTLGIDMQPARRLAVNELSAVRVGPEELLTDVQRWATVEYEDFQAHDVRASLRWTVARPGTAHGLVAGFDRTLAEGVRLSNAPDAPDAERPTGMYPMAFFPLERPVAVAAGDCVAVDLQAVLVGGDYVWSWQTRVHADGGAGVEKARFTQSTFLGLPLSPEQLHKRAAGHRPALNERGRVARFVLDHMDRGVRLDDLAARLAQSFPARFPRAEDALAFVADFSQHYG